MKILLTLFLILTLFGCERNYIKDFKIEGIGLGDSLLDKYSKGEILEFQWNHYIEKGYNSSSFFPKTMNSEYEQIEVGYKNNDNKFIVLSIGGGIAYDTDIENCYPKKKEIIKNLSQLLKNNDWIVNIYEDDKGKYDYEYLILSTGEYITVSCTDWNSYVENELNWVDNLRVRVSSAEWEDMKNE